MKLAMITADVAALGVLFGSALNIFPAIAGVLAVVYYGFLIYDRVRYGPDIEGRMRWANRSKTNDS